MYVCLFVVCNCLFCVFLLANASAGGSEEQIQFLVSSGCLNPMADLLQVHDSLIAKVALDFFKNVKRSLPR